MKSQIREAAAYLVDSMDDTPEEWKVQVLTPKQFQNLQTQSGRSWKDVPPISKKDQWGFLLPALVISFAPLIVGGIAFLKAPTPLVFFSWQVAGSLVAMVCGAGISIALGATMDVIAAPAKLWFICTKSDGIQIAACGWLRPACVQVRELAPFNFTVAQRRCLWRAIQQLTAEKVLDDVMPYRIKVKKKPLARAQALPSLPLAS